MTDFAVKYGPWALVAGGAQGIGEAYSRKLALLGLNVAVLDSSREALDTFVPALGAETGVETLALHIDLSSSKLLEEVQKAVGDREIGMLVYNAGLADVGPFYKADTGLEHELKKIAVNVSGPLLLSYHFAKAMLRRRSGGIILMSSGAGLQGSPYYSHYAATRAYNIVLGESLWAEFKPCGVDVLSCAAGMTLSTAAEGFEHLDTSTFQTPERLVEEAIAALGQQSLLIAGNAQREGMEAAKGVPREMIVEFMAQHAVDNFLNGEIPDQNI
jgi:uncharacterized protein